MQGSEFGEQSQVQSAECRARQISNKARVPFDGVVMMGIALFVRPVRGSLLLETTAAPYQADSSEPYTRGPRPSSFPKLRTV